MRLTLAIALMAAALCAAGSAGAGAVGAARATAAAAGRTAGAATQAAGCAKARVTRARRKATTRRPRAHRPARRATARVRMSRKTQRSCNGYGPATWAPATASLPAGTAAAPTPGADPSRPSSPSDPSSPTAPPDPAPGSAPVAPVISTLGAGAYDIDGFVLRLTRTSVPAGNLTVFFRNNDVSDHNLWIEGPGGDVLERISDTVGEGGGGSRTLAVTAGSWRLFCALPDHGAMTRTLTVTP
ncbi:MAG: hypothetical protein QOJ89_1358 [bacterium]